MRFIHDGAGDNAGRKRQSGYGSDRPLISQPVREHTGDNSANSVTGISPLPCRLSVSFTRAIRLDSRHRHMRTARQLPGRGALPPSSFSTIASRRPASTLRLVLPIGIGTALKKTRKEKANENQDERKGWSKKAGCQQPELIVVRRIIRTARQCNENQNECEGGRGWIDIFS